MSLKTLENVGRALLLRVLVFLFGGGSPRPSDWRDRPHRVLFVRDDGIGDLIVSIEVIRAIAESSPLITLDVLASPQNAPLARMLPFVSDVIVHKRGSLRRSWPIWRQLRRRGYDVVVDGRVVPRNVNVQTTCLLLATAAPWRIGLGGRGNDGIYTLKLDPTGLAHWTDFLAQLATPFGVPADSRDWRPRLPLPPDARAQAEEAWASVSSGRPRVVVNLSVGHPERWWPPERYIPVLARLRERAPNATIMIVGMPSERALAESLARDVGGRALMLSLIEVIAVVGTADILISPDTSVTHAASAFATPAITLQRRGSEKWMPYRTVGRTVFSDDARQLRDLPAEPVVRALDELLSEIGPARGWLRP